MASLQPTNAPRPTPEGRPRRRSGAVPTALRVRRTVVFAIAAGVPAYLALRGGGYDLIVRHEVGLVLWAALALGFAFGVLPRGRLRWTDSLPVIGAGALALLTLLSLAWTPSGERTFDELSRVVLYAGVAALPLYSLNRHTWRAAAGGLATAAIGIAAFAVATRLAPGPLPDDEVARALGSDRLSYPLDYWNGVAAWGTIAAAMALSYSAHLERTWLRCASLAAAPVAATCVYLTYSRGGVIGVALGLIAILALSRNRWTVAVHALVAAGATAVVILVIRDQPQIVAGTGGDGGVAVAAALAAAALTCGAVALITALAGLDRVRIRRRQAMRWVPPAIGAVLVIGLLAGGAHSLSRAWDQFGGQRTVAAGAEDPTQRFTTAGGTRQDVWDAALDAFSSAPAGGIGPGTFEFYWASHATVPEFVRNAHSLYLEELAELGLPGLVTLLCFVLGGVVLAIRARVGMRRPPDVAAAVAMCSAAIVFCIHAGLDWMWQLTAVAALGLAAIGVVLPARSERDPRRRLAVPMRIGAVAACLAAALIQVPGLASTARSREAAGELADGRVSDARTLDDDAVAAEPWAATPYASRAAAEMRAGDLGAAMHDLDAATSREGDNWRLWLAKAQVALAAGDEPGARGAFDRLRELDRSVAVPYPNEHSLAADPATRLAIRHGCLGYVYGACDYVTPAPLSCLPGRESADAIRAARGATVDRTRAVPIPGGGGYYVAGEVDGELTTWAIDPAGYLTGTGHVIPLDPGALRASTIGAPIDPADFGVSAAARPARTARACVRASG